MIAVALSAGLAHAAEPSEVAAQKIDALLKRLPSKTEAAVLVIERDSGETWLARNADTPLKPASVLKLFVTAAALERFGADFAFETRFAIANDELWVLAGGDPGLGDPRLLARDDKTLDGLFADWTRALQAQGVSSIERLVIDDSIFDQQWRHPDWPADQMNYWYQAPVGGLNLNDNCLDVDVKIRGDQLSIDLTPPLPDVFIRNNLRVSKKAAPAGLREEDVFTLRGTVARSGPLDPIAAGRPTVFAGHAIAAGLTEHGIALRGPVVRRDITPADFARATPIATVRTPLRDVLWRCNTFSQNLFAECLLKALAAYHPDGTRSGVAGSWDAGKRVLRDELASIGVSLEDAALRDGSGLSHDNRVTARQVVNVLRRMHTHRAAEAFRESLAVAGEPGTLRRRRGKLEGRLVGKTGTLYQVRALAGYLTLPDGTELILAVLVNGPGGGSLPNQVSAALVDAANDD